jgi:hypothetical protein
LNQERRNPLVPESFESGSQEPFTTMQKKSGSWFSYVPAFLIRFPGGAFPVTDEAVGSDEVLVWYGVSALEWVLA